MIVRVDKSGGIILPEEYRKLLDIRENSEVEIALKTDEIVIKNRNHPPT